ncbi:hypothetical protein K8I28_00730 [bacterium]|nr:hypothetical protein [bacterium]
MNIVKHMKWILILLIAILCLVDQSEARRKFKHEHLVRYEQIQEMPDGSEKTEALAQLINDDMGKILGAVAVEELARIYLKEKSYDKLYTLVKPLRKFQSVDTHLNGKIARKMVTKNNDYETAVKVLDNCENSITFSRHRAPKGIDSTAYAEHTSLMIGELRSEGARVHREAAQYARARAAIYQALFHRRTPDDYQFAGELLMIDREFRPAMGAFMASYYLGEGEASERLFHAAYDSMGWPPNNYTHYFENFFQQHVEDDANQILKIREDGEARDTDKLKVEDRFGNYGGVLIFFDDSLTELQARGLKRVQSVLLGLGLQFNYVYLGENFDATMSRLDQSGYQFADVTQAGVKEQIIYEAHRFPMVLAITPEMDFIFRIEGTNINADKLFQTMWRHVTLSWEEFDAPVFPLVPPEPEME